MERDFVSEDSGVSLVKVDPQIYSLDSVLKTAYWYTERCYVHLQFDADGTIEARFKQRSGQPGAKLPEQFMNDLLDQKLREQVEKASEPFKNLILAHALSKTSLVNAAMEIAEPFDDPKKIQVSDDAKTSQV